MDAYIRGRKITIPEIPVYKILESSAKRFPKRFAIVEVDKKAITYSELLKKSYLFASYLVNSIHKGDRVAINLWNCTEFAIAYYGTLMAGGVFVGCNPLLSNQELEYILNDSGAKVVITWSKKAEFIKENTDTREVIVIDEKIKGCTLFKDCLTDKSENVPVKIKPKLDLAHILYTGGTTGVPKGVMLTHYNVVANIVQGIVHNIGVEPKIVEGYLQVNNDPRDFTKNWEYPIRVGMENALVISPWTHSMGITSWLNQPISWGATIYLLQKFEVEKFLKAIKDYKITYAGGAPTVAAKVVGYPNFKKYIKHIRLWFSGASALPENLFYELQNAIEGVVAEGYGLTEASPAVSRNPVNRSGIRKPGSVGIPYPNTEIKIVDNDGNTLSRNEVGEIVVRGPQVMKGYWNKHKETKETLKDGWLYTGDLGKIDNDGYLYIVDRKKDMIIYKGYNIYPRKIEEIFYTHPDVEQCAVIGKKDSIVGEIPIAFVVLRKGSNISEKDLAEFVNSRLAYYERLKKIVIVDSLPTSSVGKILKRELKKLAEKISI